MKKFYPILLLLAAVFLSFDGHAAAPRYVLVDASTGELTGPSRDLFTNNTNRLITAILDHFYTQGEIGAAFQPLDAELTAFAGLTLVADRLPYGNGSGTMALATFTGFARSLLDDADAATARATLGVGSGTGDMVAVNNLSDLVSAATARVNLGLGNVDNTSDANKPVSTAQQTALDLKISASAGTGTGNTFSAPILSGAVRISTNGVDRLLIWHDADGTMISNVVTGVTLRWYDDGLDVLAGGSQHSFAADGSFIVGGPLVAENGFTADEGTVRWLALTEEPYTIASGVITPLATHMAVDTQSAAASDDLDTLTLTGTSVSNSGRIVFIRPADDARTVVVKNGTGNILTATGSDITLDDVEDAVLAIYSHADTTWYAGQIWAPSGGSGDVVGPASSVDDHVAIFDSTTGKLLKDSSGITMQSGVVSGVTAMTFGAAPSLSTSGDFKFLPTGDDFFIGEGGLTDPLRLHVFGGDADNEPGAAALYDDAGNDWFLFLRTGGALAIHSAYPTDDDADGTTLGDATLAGAQTFTGQKTFNLAPVIPRTDLAGGTTLTLNTFYEDALSANRTLTFNTSMTTEGQQTGVKFNVGAAAYTLTFPSSKLAGGADSAVTSLRVAPGVHSFRWVYEGGETVLYHTTAPRNNYAATGAPAVTNDTDEGYAVGSVWIDTTNDNSYLCQDATDGAAVWAQTDGASGTVTSVGLSAGTTGMTVGSSPVTTSGTITLNHTAEATVASATTTDIGAEASDKVSITGTTTITGLGTVAAGTKREGRFTGALTLTHNATSLILPGAANITTAAGDRFQAYSLGSGNWVVTAYVKANGSPVAFVDGSIALSKLATDPLARANHTGTQTASTISDFNSAASGASAAGAATVGGNLSGTVANATVAAVTTASANDNDTSPASTAFVQTEIAEANKGQIFLTLDGNGSAITTGQKGYVRVPWSGTITGWEIVADQSGSIVVDVWKDTYANFPPVDADSIAASELPTLSAAQKNTDTSLSWTGSGAVTAGDWIGWNVDSASTVTRVQIALFGTKN